MTKDLIVAIAKPAAICLLLGVVQFVQDYQSSAHVVPALVDGAGIASKAGLVWLGWSGAGALVQQQRGRATANAAAKTP